MKFRVQRLDDLLGGGERNPQKSQIDSQSEPDVSLAEEPASVFHRRHIPSHKSLQSRMANMSTLLKGSNPRNPLKTFAKYIPRSLPINSCPWRTMYLNENLLRRGRCSQPERQSSSEDGQMQRKNSRKSIFVIGTPARSAHLESDIYGFALSINLLVSNMEVCGHMNQVWPRYGKGTRPPRKPFGLKYRGMPYRGAGVTDEATTK
jgi:hypothetical protein